MKTKIFLLLFLSFFCISMNAERPYYIYKWYHVEEIKETDKYYIIYAKHKNKLYEIVSQKYNVKRNDEKNIKVGMDFPLDLIQVTPEVDETQLYLPGLHIADVMQEKRCRNKLYVALNLVNLKIISYQTGYLDKDSIDAAIYYRDRLFHWPELFVPDDDQVYYVGDSTIPEFYVIRSKQSGFCYITTKQFDDIQGLTERGLLKYGMACFFIDDFSHYFTKVNYQLRQPLHRDNEHLQKRHPTGVENEQLSCWNYENKPDYFQIYVVRGDRLNNMAFSIMDDRYKGFAPIVDPYAYYKVYVPIWTE